MLSKTFFSLLVYLLCFSAVQAKATQNQNHYSLAALSLNNQVGAIATLLVFSQGAGTVLAKLDLGSALSFFFKEKFDPSFFEGTPFLHTTPYGAMNCVQTSRLGQVFSPAISNSLLLCQGGDKAALFPWMGYLAQDFLGGSFTLAYSTGELRLSLPDSTQLELFDSLPLSLTTTGRFTSQIRIAGKPETAAIDTRSSLTMVDLSFVAENPVAFKKLSLSVEAVDGLGNPVIIDIYEVQQIAIGSKKLERLKVAVTDLKKLMGSDTQEKVVLGGNFLSKFDWFFDLASSRLGVK